MATPSAARRQRHARRPLRPADIDRASRLAWRHRFAVRFAQCLPEAPAADAAAVARHWSRQSDHLDADEAAEIAAMWWCLPARLAAQRELLDEPLDDGRPAAADGGAGPATQP